MKECADPKKTPTIERLLVCFLRIAHGWGVKSFPVYGAPAWEDFIEALANAEFSLPVELHFCPRFSLVRDRWEVALEEHDQILCAFFHAADIDDITGRMRFDEECDIGLDLHQDYNDIFEAMFIIGWKIEGFYELD